MTALARVLAPLRRRIQLLVNRAVLNAVNSAGGIQLLQVSTGKSETLHNLEHHEPYGYTSHPFKGADALVLSLGGSRSHCLVINVGDRRYRLAGLEEGEVALYDDQEQQIILRRDGIAVNAPLGYQFNGDGVFNGSAQFVGAVQMDDTLHVAGEASSDTDFVSDGISGKGHTHGGVTSGAANTAAPNP